MMFPIAAVSLLLFTTGQLAQACALHVDDKDSNVQSPAAVQAENIAKARANTAYRDANHSKHRKHKTTAITNVTVFDGTDLSDPRTIVIRGGRIASENSCAEEEAHETIDGTGHTLLPGLIDSHFHPDSVEHLEEATRYGVTTGVIMACPIPHLCASLHGHVGVTKVILASTPGAAVNSIHGRLLGLNVSTALGNASTSDASNWVYKQISFGAALIKLVAETPGLDQATLSAATAAAHDRGLVVACHAADYNSVQQALVAGVDQIHHVPLDRALDAKAVAHFDNMSTISVPTLIMMNKTAETIPALNFNTSLTSARALHQSNITMLVGTDANAQKLAPGHPAFGQGMHDELELLVEAGLEPLQALRSATKLAAEVWGLHDRGRVEAGMVADLLLVDGDPSRNIAATRQIRKVWVGGHAFEG